MTLLDMLTRPPRLPRAVDRPRLRGVVAAGPEPACLLLAPAGSGKSVLAAQVFDHVAGRSDVRTGWCRLAPGASGGDDLVRLVGRALGATVPDPGVTPLERAAALLDLLDEGPVVLVVDDYDLARPEECDSVLAEVLALAPADCRLVVCSASRPAGLLGRASVGHVRVVGPDELAFTEAEVDALLRLHGHEPALAPDLHAASSGWATAVAVLAETATVAPPRLSPPGSSAPGSAVRPGTDLVAAVDVLLDRAGVGRDQDADELLAMVALVPAIGPADVRALGLDEQRLSDLARSSALLRPVGDGWALLDLVRRPLQRRLDAARLHAAADRVAPVVAETDPIAAADLLMTTGNHEAAADVLARRASAVAPDAALPLLYRMPAEVRRRLPPLLSAARATVEMDSALAGAEQRLAAAQDPHDRLEAQVTVGTILVHRGQLASAAAILESALRTATATGGQAAIPPDVVVPPRSTATSTDTIPEPVSLAATTAGWLALARFWAGDVDGAAAVVETQLDAAIGRTSTAPGETGPVADDDPVVGGTPGGHGEGDDEGVAPLTWWVAAEVALDHDDLAAVARAIAGLRAAGWVSAADAMAARHSLARGDEQAAVAAAGAAYRMAAAVGGIDLLVAAPVQAWCLARADRWDEAAAVADELRRRMGAVDTCARLHADLVTEAHAARRGDRVARSRTARAIAATRRLGYAPVDAAARRWLAGPGPTVRSPEGGGQPAPASPAQPAPDRSLGQPDGSQSPDASTAGVQAAAPLRAGLEVRLLGPVTIHVDGEAVLDGGWRSRKAREVLLVLVLAGEPGLSRDEVVEAVWPERDPTKGRTSLRTALHEVRQVLEPQRPPGEPSRFVTTQGDRVVVHAWSDLAEAEQLRARATTARGQEHQATSDAGIAALGAAWKLFRGRFAADEPYAGSLDEARRATERLHLDVAEALVAAGTTTRDAAGTTGDDGPPARRPLALDQVVAAAAHILDAEPWRIDIARQVAQACRAAGDEAQARRAERLATDPRSSDPSG